MNTDQQRGVAALEQELQRANERYLALWAAIEAAFGVKAGHFPNARAVIEHGCRLRNTDPPPGGQVIVQGWRPKLAPKP